MFAVANDFKTIDADFLTTPKGARHKGDCVLICDKDPCVLAMYHNEVFTREARFQFEISAVALDSGIIFATSKRSVHLIDETSEVLATIHLNDFLPSLVASNLLRVFMFDTINSKAGWVDTNDDQLELQTVDLPFNVYALHAATNGDFWCRLVDGSIKVLNIDELVHAESYSKKDIVVDKH